MESKVKDILLLLEQNGWSDLIDSRWGHSPHRREISYIISVYQQRVREMMLE